MKTRANILQRPTLLAQSICGLYLTEEDTDSQTAAEDDSAGSTADTAAESSTDSSSEAY